MERVFRCRAVTAKAKIKVTLNREDDVCSVGPTVAHQLNFLIILTSSNFWILIDIKIWASKYLKEEIDTYSNAWNRNDLRFRAE